MLYLLGPELREYEGDALAEELKFAARRATSYERVAVVSDQDWLRPALRVLSALVPGQLRVPARPARRGEDVGGRRRAARIVNFGHVTEL